MGEQDYNDLTVDELDEKFGDHEGYPRSANKDAKVDFAHGLSKGSTSTAPPGGGSYEDIDARREAARTFEPPVEGADHPDPYAHLPGSNAFIPKADDDETVEEDADE